MKRRDFFKTSAAAAGIVGYINISPFIDADEIDSGKSSGTLVKDNRPAEYLQRVQNRSFLTKPTLVRKSYPLSPMPLKERIKRKIVPQHGFCSIVPGNSVRETLTSGNGTTTIELMGDPYSEQILFHHESLLMPWKRPIEAPNVASIFSQVRQMALDGKTKDAVDLALQHMNESPLKQDTEPHLTIPAFLMKLNLVDTSSANNYLRTVNFENGEIKVFWTGKNGEWLRQAFTSQPDDVVVQKLTAPTGKKINIKISLEKSAQWSMVSGMDWGATSGIGTTDPDMAAFTDLSKRQKELAPKGVEANEVKQDCDEHRLIYKCLLDTSVDNSGYAGITRMIRDGGSARVDGKTLVVENASSIMLLTRIEYFSDFSDDKVEVLRKAVEGITPDYSA